MLDRLSIKVRLAIIVVISVVGLLVLGAYELQATRAHLIEQHQKRLQTITEIAGSIIKGYYDQYESGQLSLSEAKRLAALEVQKLHYDEKNYVWVNDLDGLLVAHPHRAKQIGTSMMALKDKNGKLIYQAFVAAAKAGGGFVNYVGPKPGSTKLTSPKLAHIRPFAPWNWGIGTGAYIDDIDVAFWKAAQRVGLIVLAVTIVSAMIAFLASLSITRSLSDLGQVMLRLANGETNLSVPFCDLNHELGAIAKATDIFRVNAIEKNRLEAEQVDAKKRSEEEKRAAMHEMAGNLESGVGEIVHSLSSAATEMQSTAQSMSSIAEETNTQATTVTKASEQASSSVQTVASAAEELGSSIAEISRQMADQTNAADEAVRSVQLSDAEIKALADKVEAIGDVINLITGIAEQTNLLALNATIEAARAGDAGKGFAVVASEVKNLASQTAQATEDIEQRIKGVQETTKTAVHAIGEIGGKIANIKEISSTVAAAVEEQNAAAMEISRSSQNASTSTSQVSQAIVDVTKASQETGESATHVLQAAGELSQYSSELSTKVAAFVQQIRNS